jgi:diguanylate cyclase (GGDEF)-like protein
LNNGRLQSDATLVLAVELDEYPALVQRFGIAASERILRRAADRMELMVRETDVVAHLGGHRFAIMLTQNRQLDMEIALQLSERLHRELADPFTIDTSTIYVTASVGMCLARRLKECTAFSLLQGAEVALEEARRHGGNALRIHSDEMAKIVAARHDLISEVPSAFELGQIVPWFQPQICTDTGRISGFEALARWKHPTRGMIPPMDFLESVETAGMMSRLGEVMLFHGLAALRSWDRAGYDVGSVGVNFSSTELRNPKLVDKLKWELDRFDIQPERLTIEVLETVVATTENDAITKNIAALATLGCTIDLDDFGTGHASISNIRRFAVNRIKIDRSFVTNIDSDPQQQKMVSAILMMAEQLDLHTLAEGVETIAEHAMLSQLGCNFVQGYGLSRPMPFEDTIGWMEKHTAKLQKTPRIGSLRK